MRMQKKQFRIGALADELQVERFVIRFWEKEFDIKSQRSSGGQRYYTEKDLATFKTIKELLYKKKYTIAGAKKMLADKEKGIIASQKTTMDQCDELHIDKEALLHLRNTLTQLKHLLNA